LGLREDAVAASASTAAAAARAAAGGAPADLPALTSLRLFAALAIVLHHAQGHFGIAQGFASPFVLDQGVSFFFVLSGFILFHVHADLQRGREGRFRWARFARIWPAHGASFVLVLMLFGWEGANGGRSPGPAVAFANLALVHAWFPWTSVFFSFNNVSWTLSVEAFFYATFPLVIRRIERRWPVWLLASLVPALALVAIAAHLELPPSDSEGIGADALVYIHPLARWFEFVLGICAALAWRRARPRPQLRGARASAAEVAALGAALLAAWQTLPAARALADWTGGGPPLALWLLHGPIAAPAFALAIVALAAGRGGLSRALSSPLLVHLGEISYALYLVHYACLRLAWDVYPDASAGAGFTLVLLQMLLAARLLWQGVERPARRALVALYPLCAATTRAAVVQGRWSDLRSFAWTALAHTAVVLALIVRQRMAASP